MKKIILPAILFVSTVFFSGCNWLSPQATQQPTTNTTETTETMKRDPQEGQTTSPSTAGGMYVNYTPAAYTAASNKRRVLFFHASWCPTCKVLNQELLEQSELLPDDVVIFKTDYDTESELKKKYGITYQHTLVQVDENGNVIKKWNGGGVQEILKNLQGAQ